MVAGLRFQSAEAACVNAGDWFFLGFVSSSAVWSVVLVLIGVTA